MKEVADILRVPPARVYALVRLGQLPAVFLGERQVRIVEEALLEWIQAGGAKAAAAASANQRPTSEPEVRRG